MLVRWMCLTRIPWLKPRGTHQAGRGSGSTPDLPTAYSMTWDHVGGVGADMDNTMHTAQRVFDD
jgi:hypothetical protein